MTTSIPRAPKASSPSDSFSVFGWQGLVLHHPPAWAPVALHGSRRDGYARFAVSDSLTFQLRWSSVARRGAAQGVRNALSLYRRSMERRARRAGGLQWEAEDVEAGTVFQWTSDRKGRGMVVASPDGERLAMMELSGSKKDSLLPLFRPVAESMRFCCPDECWTWSVLGAQAQLPASFRLERSTFVSGRASLSFRRGLVSLKVARQALALESLGEASLHEWAQTRSGRRASIQSPDPHRAEVRLSSPMPWVWPTSGSLLLLETACNQLRSLAWSHPNPAWRPPWDWLG